MYGIILIVQCIRIFENIDVLISIITLLNNTDTIEIMEVVMIIIIH